MAALLTACGPAATTTDSQTQTTKTTTTTTTTNPTVPPAPPMPAPTALTQANLDRVQTDMSAAEVQAIFGPPTSSSSKPIPIVGGTETTYSYSNGGSAVTIVFKNDQVKEKSGTFAP
jgi:hypothetical protein